MLRNGKPKKVTFTRQFIFLSELYEKTLFFDCLENGYKTIVKFIIATNAMIPIPF